MHRFYAYEDKHNNRLLLVLHVIQLEKKRESLLSLINTIESTYDFLLILFFEFVNEEFDRLLKHQEIQVDSQYQLIAH